MNKRRSLRTFLIDRYRKMPWHLAFLDLIESAILLCLLAFSASQVNFMRPQETNDASGGFLAVLITCLICAFPFARRSWAARRITTLTFVYLFVLSIQPSATGKLLAEFGLLIPFLFLGGAVLSYLYFFRNRSVREYYAEEPSFLHKWFRVSKERELTRLKEK